MNKEEFKLSIVNEANNYTERMLMLLLLSAIDSYIQAKKYRDKEVFYHKDFDLEFELTLQDYGGQRPQVSVEFRDIGDHLINWEECASKDFASKGFMPKFFARENIFFDEDSIILDVELFKIIFVDNELFLTEADDAVTIRYSPATQQYNYSVDLFKSAIDVYRNDRENYVYIDADLNNKQINDFDENVQNYVGLTPHHKSLYRRFILGPNKGKGYSPIMRFIDLVESLHAERT